MSCVQDEVDELLRQANVGQVDGVGKERGNVPCAESGDAAADACHEEVQPGVCPCEGDELVGVRSYGVDTSVHGRYAVGLSLQSVPLSEDGSEASPGEECGSSPVHAFEVAAEDEDFIFLQSGDEFGSNPACVVVGVHGDEELG